MTKTQIFGHRGAKGYRPENTMASFEYALELGCDGIELDVFCTLDGIPVVFHDEDTLALTGVPGRIADMTFAEVQSLRVGGEPIPSLRQVMREFAGKCVFNIELKDLKSTNLAADEIATIQSEKQLGPTAFIVSSFLWDNLRQLANLYPEIPTAVLSRGNLEETISFATQIGAKAVHPHFSELTPDAIRDIQQRGLRVNAWTVNDAETRERLVESGVDAIITDYPHPL